MAGLNQRRGSRVELWQSAHCRGKSESDISDSILAASAGPTHSRRYRFPRHVPLDIKIKDREVMKVVLLCRQVQVTFKYEGGEEGVRKEGGAAALGSGARLHISILKSCFLTAFQTFSVRMC